MLDTVHLSFWIVITRKGHHTKRKCAVVSAGPGGARPSGTDPSRKFVQAVRRTCFRWTVGSPEELFVCLGSAVDYPEKWVFFPPVYSLIL